jgi:hypothetical protein
MPSTPKDEPDVVILDDRELYEIIFSAICTYCHHWHAGEGRYCDAFPSRTIPKAIWEGHNLHIQPVGGETKEHGQPITFAPAPGVVRTPENEKLLDAYEAASAGQNNTAGDEERRLLSARAAAILLGVVPRADTAPRQTAPADRLV